MVNASPFSTFPRPLPSGKLGLGLILLFQSNFKLHSFIWRPLSVQPQSPSLRSTSNLNPQEGQNFHSLLLSTIYLDFNTPFSLSPIISGMLPIRSFFLLVLFTSWTAAKPIEEIYKLRSERSDIELDARQQQALTGPITFQTVTTTETYVGNRLLIEEMDG